MTITLTSQYRSPENRSKQNVPMLRCNPKHTFPTGSQLLPYENLRESRCMVPKGVGGVNGATFPHLKMVFFF